MIILQILYIIKEKKTCVSIYYFQFKMSILEFRRALICYQELIFEIILYVVIQHFLK